MAKTSRKCGRCGSRETKPGRKVAGYGSVCPRCFELCAFPVEAVAQGLAALATGAIRLPLGFTSYRELRERRAAEEAATRARQEEAQRAATRALEARLSALRVSLSRVPRRRRGEIAGRIRALAARVGAEG